LSGRASLRLRGRDGRRRPTGRDPSAAVMMYRHGQEACGKAAGGPARCGTGRPGVKPYPRCRASCNVPRHAKRWPIRAFREAGDASLCPPQQHREVQKSDR
jgi:hypothetical protein